MSNINPDNVETSNRSKKLCGDGSAHRSFHAVVDDSGEDPNGPCNLVNVVVHSGKASTCFPSTRKSESLHAQYVLFLRAAQLSSPNCVKGCLALPSSSISPFPLLARLVHNARARFTPSGLLKMGPSIIPTNSSLARRELAAPHLCATSRSCRPPQREQQDSRWWEVTPVVRDLKSGPGAPRRSVQRYVILMKYHVTHGICYEEKCAQGSNGARHRQLYRVPVWS